jgi:CheY-like chemotaxis protein
MSMLRKLGYSDIDLAEDGEEAIAKAAEKTYNLILMDCQMPRMDGYEATSILRQRGFTLPIVAITANAMAEEVEHCMSVGMNGHVEKPVAIKALAAALEKFLTPVSESIELNGP